MSHRQNTSPAGAVTYPAGSSTSAITVTNTSYSQVSNGSALLRNGAYNGHAVEVFGDGAVWDTVTGTYLFPFRDYNPLDLQRT
jgi:hypothetical protein